MDDIALLVLVGVMSQVLSIGVGMLLAWGTLKLIFSFWANKTIPPPKE